MVKQVEVGDVGHGKSLEAARDDLMDKYDPAVVLGEISLPVNAKEFAKRLKEIGKGHPGATVKVLGDRAVIFDR